ncbi:MAG: siroheme decarboxylase subunit beta [Candidatus Latescibacterota bacterium]
MPNLTAKEKKLLSVIQSDIPVVERPYKKLAERIGWSENDVMESIRTLLQNGVIRAFSPVFEARLLGYVSTLVAVEIDREKVDAFAAALLPINEITHNYLRDHAFAVWFTISAESETVINDMLSWIEQYPGVRSVRNLPALKVYKVCAVFGETPLYQKRPHKNRMIWPLKDEELQLVRCLQKGFPLVEYPFRHIAEEIDVAEGAIIDTVRDWIEYGVIRRFGARLNHHRAGYVANALGVWKTDDCDRLGELFASLPWVSHCYRRSPHPNWPYELYTMTHGRSEEELTDRLSHMRSLAPGAEMKMLTTLRTLKKTTMKYFPKEGPWVSLKSV